MTAGIALVASAIVAFLFFRILAKNQNQRTPQPRGSGAAAAQAAAATTPNWKQKTLTTSAFLGKFILPSVILAFAAIWTWEPSWVDTVWKWVSKHKILSLTTIAELIVWLAFAKGWRPTIHDLRDYSWLAFVLALTASIFLIAYGWETGAIKDGEANIIAAERMMPKEQSPPYEVEVDPIPDELVPPGGHSSWIIWWPRYLTDTKISAPARYIKGRANEKGEVIVRDPTPKWEYPGKPDGMSDWDAQMYLNEGTGVLKIQKTRRLR